MYYIQYSYFEWLNVILMLYFLLQDMMTLFWTRYKYGSCGIWTSRITYIWCMSVLENVYIMSEWHRWIHCMCNTLNIYAELGCICVDKSVCDRCDELLVFVQCGICVCELDGLEILKTCLIGREIDDSRTYMLNFVAYTICVENYNIYMYIIIVMVSDIIYIDLPSNCTFCHNSYMYMIYLFGME